MKSKSPSPLAPYNFARCFNTQCAKADNCLHRLAALHDTPEYPTIRIINPMCIPADSSKCTYFISSEKIHVAWGIKHLFDNVLHKDVQTIKSQLFAHFSKGKYYRFYREECYLTPEDQNFIRKVFRQNGIKEEPAFDAFSDEYRW